MNKQEKAELIEKLANETGSLYNKKVYEASGYKNRSPLNMWLVRHCIVEKMPPKYKIKLRKKEI